MRQWRAKNRDRLRAYSAAYLEDWRARNPDKNSEYCARWRAKNPDRARAAAASWREGEGEASRLLRQARRAINKATGVPHGIISRDVVEAKAANLAVKRVIKEARRNG